MKTATTRRITAATAAVALALCTAAKCPPPKPHHDSGGHGTNSSRAVAKKVVKKYAGRTVEYGGHTWYLQRNPVTGQGERIRMSKSDIERCHKKVTTADDTVMRYFMTIKGVPPC